MGFEIINYLKATPHRLYETLKLIKELGEINETLLEELLQPEFVNEEPEVVKNVIKILNHFKLIQEDNKKIKLTSTEINYLDSLDTFRLKMQKVMLGATNENQDNFLLSQVTAWYASKNHQILNKTKTEFSKMFHNDLYPSIRGDSAQNRRINENSSILSWGLWARFLGFGKEYDSDVSSGRQLLPNARGRIFPLLEEIFKSTDSILIGDFLQRLGNLCTELDGGTLYKKVFETINSKNENESTLSLMLSTALRQLDAEKVIKMEDSPDALQRRQLFPSQSYLNQVSHVHLLQKE